MSRAPFRHSPETSKLPLMVMLDCQALWHPPDIAPTPASTEEQSSVEMRSQSKSSPADPPFPLSPPALCGPFPITSVVQAPLLVSPACWWLSNLITGTCRVWHGSWGWLSCSSRGMQPCLHPGAHSSVGFPHCPGQLQEQYELLRLGEK